MLKEVLNVYFSLKVSEYSFLAFFSTSNFYDIALLIHSVLFLPSTKVQFGILSNHVTEPNFNVKCTENYIGSFYLILNDTTINKETAFFPRLSPEPDTQNATWLREADALR